MKILRIHSLKRGWCEWDHLLLHACFQVLVDFMEQDRPAEIVDWDSDPEHRQAWTELRDLHHWWKETRPARHDPFDVEGIKSPPPSWEDEEYDREDFPEYFEALARSRELQEQWDAEDERNLRRLIEVRRWLWC